MCPAPVVIGGSDLITHEEFFEDWGWEPVPDEQKATCQLDPVLQERLAELDIAFEIERTEDGAGSGTIGATKSFHQALDPVFLPRTLTLLANYQAIGLPYDGAQALPTRSVCLMPHHLPRQTGYRRPREKDQV